MIPGQSGVLSPSSGNSAFPGFQWLKSNFGSRANLNGVAGISHLNRHSTLRFTGKVNQIAPPSESDEEHDVSLDSNDNSKETKAAK